MGFTRLIFRLPAMVCQPAKLSDGLTWTVPQLYGASYDPGLLVTNAGINNAPGVIDRTARGRGGSTSGTSRSSGGGGKPGGRGCLPRQPWCVLQTNNLVGYNTVNQATLKALGLDITNATVRNLLTASIILQRLRRAGFSKPYANFPSSATVIQSLRPYPQYGTIGSTWAPLGASWYDALQAKVNKRYSSGWTSVLPTPSRKTRTIMTPTAIYSTASTFKSLTSYSLRKVLTITIDYKVQAKGFIAAEPVFEGAACQLDGWLDAANTTSGSLLAHRPPTTRSAPICRANPAACSAWRASRCS